jgi:hypothetical protein
MADKICVAVKPKYPTRKATDRVLTKNEANFIDVVEVDVARQVIALLDTSYVAIIKDDQYYPVDVDNVFEQYEHLAAGEDLTVEADEKFGVKKLESFFSVPEDEDVEDLDKIQDKVEIYNAILSGKLVKVEDYSKLGIDAIDKNGYWLAIKLDKSGAEAEGYSEIKLFGEEEELEDGVNYIYMGKSQEDIASKVISISSEYTEPEEATGEDDSEGSGDDSGSTDDSSSDQGGEDSGENNG